MSSHTPGPWEWYGNTTGGGFLDLVSRTSMTPIVMGFRRWGMGGALPTFRADGVMERADTYFVKPKPHHEWEVRGLNHPDACLIAAAPELLHALREILEDPDAKILDTDREVGWEAIAKAAPARARMAGG